MTWKRNFVEFVIRVIGYQPENKGPFAPERPPEQSPPSQLQRDYDYVTRVHVLAEHEQEKVIRAQKAQIEGLVAKLQLVGSLLTPTQRKKYAALLVERNWI